MSGKDLSNLMENGKISLIFSPEIENQMVSDKIFTKFINIVEGGLKEFIYLNNIHKITHNFYFKKDWEIPDQKNLILSLDFKELPTTQEKIELWNDITLFIQEKIIELIEISRSEEKNKFENLKYQFFIYVEPL